MDLLQRIRMLLTSPDEATYDLWDAPNITHAFLIVSIYATVSSLNSSFSAGIKTENFAFSFLAFLGTFAVTFLTWAFLTIVFHLAAEFTGGLGELPNAVAFVGMAAAPMIFTSFVSILVTLLGPLFFEEDPDLILPKLSLFVSLSGMIWGWPGILCYFGLKNGEHLHSVKAFAITLVVFLGLSFLEITNSNAF